MKKNDKLKKHHFWILAGLAPLLALLMMIFLMTGPGEAKDKAAAEIKSKFDTAKGTNPPGKKRLDEDFPKQTKTLNERRELLWKANYDAQKGIFAWPESTRLSRLEKQYEKFGTKMATPNQEFDDFKSDVYLDAYDRVAEAIQPTGFPNGTWKSALRYVSNWTSVYPKSDQVWLALEDLWVQKGLLLPVKEVNDNAARFELMKVGPDGKPGEPAALKRTFRNRIWELQLEVPTTGPHANKAILAKLTNLTDRLQMLGYRNGTNQMTLNIWLGDANAPAPSLRYVIQKDFAKAGEVIEVTTPLQNLHTIPQETEVKEIARVEQILDDRTVPIRQVLTVDLGCKDARHNPATLKKPDWWPEEVIPEAGVGGEGGMGGLPEGMPGGVPGGEAGVPGGMGLPGGRGMGMPGGAGTQVAKNGPPMAVLDLNKDRYVDVTKQVRRMPVAVVLLVDQMFVQDALVAYANSPLRFQITQYHWKRFRGSLSSSGGSSMYGGGMGFPSFGGFGRGEFGSGSGGEGGLPEGGDMGMPDGGGEGGESGYVLPGGPGGMMEPGGMMGSGGYGMPGMGTSGSVSEGQITSGLVELTLYGIVTLYNKYETEAEAAATATLEAGTAPEGEAKEKGEAPASDDAAKEKGEAPAPKSADPKDGAATPMNPTPPPAPAPSGTTPEPGPAPKGTTPEGAPPPGTTPGTPKN